MRGAKCVGAGGRPCLFATRPARARGASAQPAAEPDRGWWDPAGRPSEAHPPGYHAFVDALGNTLALAQESDEQGPKTYLSLSPLRRHHGAEPGRVGVDRP